MQGVLRCLVAGAALCGGVAAKLQLPAWFGDHMVLQTNSEYGARAFLNGLTDPNGDVTVRGGSSHTVACDS